MFTLAVLVRHFPAIRRVLAFVEDRPRTADPARSGFQGSSELQRALAALEGDRVLELHLRFPLRGMGDAERFRMTVEHFLRSAEAFSPPRSRIRVEAYATEDRVHVVIAEDGAGVPADLVLPVAASAVRPPPRQPDDLPEPYDLRGVA